MTAKTYKYALPAGHTLLWYQIEQVLGQGAFGITYLARDVNLERLVAVKEFFPTDTAARVQGGTVQVLSDDTKEEFAQGIERFLKEARTLAKFEHDNIVRVLNVFEANGTAYMAMRYEEGRTLKEVLRQCGGRLSEPEIMNLILPLLDGLEHIHAAGVIHRDIKPANIFMRQNGTPLLIDFGSARQALPGISQNLTSFVSEGFAAIEQYSGRSANQGPWSDIYGLGATLYRVMTGTSPATAVERSEAISLGAPDPLADMEARMPKHYSARLVTAVAHAMRYRATDRPQSIARWREMFLSGAPDEIPTATTLRRPLPANVAMADEQRTQHLDPATQKLEPRTQHILNQQAQKYGQLVLSRWRTLPRYGQAAAIAMLLLLAAMWWQSGPTPPAPLPDTPVMTETPAAPPDPMTATAEVTPATTTATTPASGSVDGTITTDAGTAPEPAAEAANPAAENEPSPDSVAGLLRAARADLSALRLTTPAGNNAYEKYQRVLTLSPGNPRAQRGITAIAEQYVGLVYRDLEDNRISRAQEYLQKAEQIAPTADFVIEARSAFDEKVQAAMASTAGAPVEDQTAAAPPQQKKSGKFFKRFRDFLNSDSPRDTGNAKKTRADEMRERMGGQR